LPRPDGQPQEPVLGTAATDKGEEFTGATEDNQIAYSAKFVEHGINFNVWWIDAGWYPCKNSEGERKWWLTGTWMPDSERFPNGLRPVADHLATHEARLLLWFEPERVTNGSKLFLEHPEWLLTKPEPDNDSLLNLGDPECRKWLTDFICDLIQSNGVHVYRQDFNFEPLGLWRGHDAEDRQGITEIQHVTGYLAYWDELRRRFPKLLIDTCASGGRRLDLETLRRAVPLWRSDFAYVPAPMQQFTYGLALWVPYFGTAFNSLDPYIFWSQMTPAVGIGLDVERLESDAPAIQRLLGEWRAVAELYYGDYYPLTPYSTEPTAWLAWQFDDAAQKKGMVQAFRRPESPFETARFQLRGLEAGARYAVRDLDSQKETRQTGKELMEPGLEVTIRSRPGVVNLVYRKVE